MEPDSTKISMSGLSLSELEELLYRYNIDKVYATRLHYWIYKRAVLSFDLINDIPKKVLSDISKNFITGAFKPYSSLTSDDGSVKYLFKNRAGLLYEAVYIPDGLRRTICVSVQSGCAMGCSFCATGTYGWHGDLTAGEIVNQVVSLPYEITHVVLMGMGEPCDNIDETIKACNILTAEWGLAKGKANVTVSTVGVMTGLKRLLEETECNITLSLHSPFPEERAAIIPAEKTWPAMQALEMISNFNASRRRRFTVAYVMIDGVNDSDKHLVALKELLYGTGIRVNLLPYHKLPGDTCKCSSPEKMMKFKHNLVTSGIGASVRKSRGSDVYAACGMLAATVNDESISTISHTNK
jgi:23S rRNA (adenine2503-C2)-methyltransferase